MAKKDKHEEAMFVLPDEPVFAPPDPTEVLIPPPPPVAAPAPAPVKAKASAPMASHLDEPVNAADAIVRRLAGMSRPQLGGSHGVQLINDAKAWVASQEPQ